MVNSAPALSGLSASLSVTENDAPQPIDSDVTFDDPDGSLDGGTLTVSGLLPEDRVAILNEGVGAGQIGISGTDVTYGGTVIGTFTGGDGTSLIVTFNAAATPAAIEALIEHLTYADSSDAPTASRTLTVEVDDGFATTSSSIDIQVAAVNDAPAIDLDSSDSPATGTSLVYGEGQAPVPIAPFAIVSDPDQPADFGGYTLTVTFTGNGTADDQLTIVRSGVGLGQVITFGSDVYFEGVIVATFTGGDNGNPLVISFNNAACGCSLEAITASIAFSNVSDDPSTLAREVTFTVDDGAASDNIGSAVATITVIANDPPVLTDLATSVTFAENLVNATPQLLDASVTLTDPDGNFDGATLTVSGLLFEDEVGIRDVGTGAGEISVSGSDVSYGGLLIGTVCGCSDSLTLLFNADATAAAIEAVIENLTYLNHSDSPTESRTLIINVTDSFGADLGEAAVAAGTLHFEPLAGPADPFYGFAVYGLAAPVFVDLDGDGDLDLVVGDAYGNLSLFENDGGAFAPVADADNPFADLAVDEVAKPVFADLDGDGDLDLVVGTGYGNVQFFENVAGVFTERTGAANPFDSISVSFAAAPAFADLDGDGDLDLVVGDYAGALHVYENDAGTFTELNGPANPLDGMGVYGLAAPVFVDLDGDGDLDLVVGDLYGNLSTFENDGGAFTELTGADNPFNGLYGGESASPAFADLDGDGDLDLVTGEYSGTLATFENTPPHGQSIVVNVTPENDAPFLDLDFTDADPAVNTSASFTEGDPPLAIAPLAFFGDPDQPDDYGGYVVTVELTQNGDTDDTLTIADIGPGADEIEISGSDVLYEGVIVGSFTGGTNGDPLVVTFNSDACACSVELVLENILFSNGSQHPSALTRTVTFTLDDGDGGTASALATIDVTPVDDSPIVPDSPAVAATEQVAVTLNAALAVSDVDLDARNGGNGDYGGASFTIGESSPNANDQFGFAASGLFAVSAGNLQSGGLTFATFSQSGGLLTIDFTSSGTPATSALVDDVLQHLQYTYSGDSPPSSVTLIYTLDDGAPDAVQGPLGAALGNLDSGQVTVTITNTPEAPIVDLNGAGAGTSTTIGYTENQPLVAIAPAATVVDLDSPNFDTGVLTVQIDAGGDAGDLLRVIDQGGAVGKITVSDPEIYYNFGHLDGDNLPVGPELIGTFSGGTDGFTPLVVTLNATANAQAVQALVRAIGYENSSDDPGGPTRTLTYTLTDGDGQTSQGAVATINVTAVADGSTAFDDNIFTNDNVPVAGNVFAANGNGTDFSADGQPFLVNSVNGSAGNVGVQIILASGAKLIVNADGSFSYDPNGQHNALVPISSGAANFQDTDSFTYTIEGGGAATATIFLNGIVSPGDIYKGDSGDNAITGTTAPNIFRVEQGGNDTIVAGGGNDLIYYGAALTAADSNNGGSSRDVVVLQGNYNLTFGAQSLVNVEFLSVQSGSVTRFGDLAGHSYDYDLTTLDANVAAGQVLTINAQSLRAGEDLTFDGSAETNGSFFIYGGRGADTLTGGAGNDIFFFEGDRWGAGDRIDGGAGARDALVITGGDGTNHVVIGNDVLDNVESISVNARFASDPSALPSYVITIGDNNSSNGSLIVNASSLGVSQQAAIDGSAVTDGSLKLFGGAGVDHLTGGALGDTLYGGRGSDLLTGGAGNDVFRYDDVGESVVGGRDGILDFASGDKIDLSRIDAVSTTAGNDSFSFIGSGAFSGTAGELRAVNSSGSTWTISGDTNGDGVADIEIVVNVSDAHPIVGGDFML